RGSSATTPYWRDTRVSGDGRKHRLYALEVEKLSNGLERTVHPRINKTVNCVRGSTLNDINVLDRSPVFDDIIQGRAPRVEYVVNGHMYNLAYYLTDGIYPNWSTFIQSISVPQGPKAELFAKLQESTRKDVERAFGVLQARFAIVKNPALSWDQQHIGRQ
uniref:Uncharacterized protein n=1 Tax=Brassica oleracea var. oleracea TaxID=109376 RepID=A0A0D3DGL1_BRAOL